MLVLAVERQQPATEPLEVGERRRAAAHICPRAAVGPDTAREHDLVGAVGDQLGVGDLGRDREHALDIGLLSPGAHHAAPRAAAEQQVERVRQQRLAGPRLAGQHVQPRGEPQLGAIHQQQVLDPEFVEHQEWSTNRP